MAKSNRRQRGYSLISVILLLAGMAVVASMHFRDQAFKHQMKMAENAGKHLRQLNDGIEAYLIAHGPRLRSMQDNDCAGVASCVPAVWFCAVGGNPNQCALDLNRLVAEGYLPAGWINENPWRAAYQTTVTRVLKPNGNPALEMDYDLRAITVSSAPWVDVNSGNPLLGMLGQAVRAGGADLAMTSDSPTIATGLVRRTYNADMETGTTVTWEADSTMNPGISAIGHLVARAGFESTANNSFPFLVKRDGSVPMTGALDMGANKITSLQDAFIKANSRNLAASAPTWVFKYTVRITQDGLTVQKPDCSAPSGGWTGRTTLTDPWDPDYNAAIDPNRAHDQGEPRILISMDTMKDLKVLGYNSAGSSPAPSQAQAYEQKARAKGSYEFFAVDQGTSWKAYIRYYQDTDAGAVAATGGAYEPWNTYANAQNSQGIASVYCYYDSRKESGCNGETGCDQNGQSNPAGSAAAPDLAAPISATSTAPYQDPILSGGSSTVTPGTGASDTPEGF